MIRHRFISLLAALVLLLVVSPILVALSTHPLLTEGLASLAFVIVMITAVVAVSQQRRQLHIALALAIPTILLDAAEMLTHSEGILCAYSLLAICFLGYTVILILQRLFASIRVTADAIAASVCVYIILGVMWALAYTALEVLQPGSFQMAFSNQDHADFLGLGSKNSAAGIYYSLVTLSTLGFGDITPTSPMARMLSVVEALTGQIYLAVLVARLVGMHISQNMAARGAHQDSK